jgi:DNA-binding HxlR family transcriptional regulator
MEAGRERRSYDQHCGIAVALDVLGERWTLLIVRELLAGPRRYGQLLDALSGIGTNLLAERLKTLTELGVVQPLDTERRRAGYPLTELGEQLREPLLGLARWGLTVMAHDPELSGTVVRSQWAILGAQALIDDSGLPDVDETHQFTIDDEVFHIAVEHGHARPGPGCVPDPTLKIGTDAKTFFALGSGQLDPIEALLSDRVRVEGDPAAVPRCLKVLGFKA